MPAKKHSAKIMAASQPILWTYTVVVWSILKYSFLMWWPVLSNVYYINHLWKLQRSACVRITGTLRSHSTHALNLVLELLSQHFHIKYQIACCALTLKNSGCWKARDFGHSNMWYLIPKEMFQTPTDNYIPSNQISVENRLRAQ